MAQGFLFEMFFQVRLGIIFPHRKIRTCTQSAFLRRSEPLGGVAPLDAHDHASTMVHPELSENDSSRSVILPEP